eukprot:gnl/TRDRNA2_/TRDRNA2_35378_c0_seq1.p1 gnl/TRDRNA2_/TRDRNA2_35378_c0~~gnl/TRDRNA2_/TRDRNA2_35378_c0_seq1.p1  ORF type:complete len:749 (+),score=175.30 gnl/TRDRNA2_/TRDRNA2_35378_c0_seq1:229-2247(+)
MATPASSTASTAIVAPAGVDPMALEAAAKQQAAAGLSADSTATGSVTPGVEEPDAKRRRIGTESDKSQTPAVASGVVATPATLNAPSNLGNIVAPSVPQTAGFITGDGWSAYIPPEVAQATALPAAMTPITPYMRMAGGVGTPGAAGILPPGMPALPAPASTPALAKPAQRPPRIRQYIRPDWRWSKGYQATFSFEELTLPEELQELAQKVLGGKSRYPARIADDTDCTVSLTAWGSIILRPRGTGGDLDLAKAMVHEVLLPTGTDLQEEVMMEKDEEVEEKIRDHATIGDVTDIVAKDGDKTLQRKAKKNLARVGVGAETLIDAPDEEVVTAELPLPSFDVVPQVRAHLGDLRVATKVLVTLSEATLTIKGPETAVLRAKILVYKLIETGEWGALSEAFILSEETKENRKKDDGPSTQILIKVPEGKVTQLIERHIKAMENAAECDALKLTSKAVAGKRTLMVDGTNKAHARVKLMVKELGEKGESPMLTKAISSVRMGAAALGVAEPATKPAPAAATASDASSPSKAASSGPVVSAPPIMKGSQAAAAAPPPVTAKPPKAAVGMRRMPAPKLNWKAAADAGADLFAALPAPGGEAAATAGTATAEADIFAGLPAVNEGKAAHPFPPLPPGMSVQEDVPVAPLGEDALAMLKAERELQELFEASKEEGVTE